MREGTQVASGSWKSRGKDRETFSPTGMQSALCFVLSPDPQCCNTFVMF